MADIADIADSQIEKSLQEGLRNARQVKGLAAMGSCHFCLEPIDSGLFCLPVDASGDGCARDYDRQARMLQITRGA